MKRTLLITAAAALLAIAAAPADAGTIKLGDSSAFSGSETVVDFETGVTDNVAVGTISGATFTGLYGESDASVLGLFAGSGSMVSANYFRVSTGGYPITPTVTVDFSSAMDRVGFDVATNDLDDIEVELFSFSGGSYTSLGTADSFTTGLSESFVGLQSTLAFDRVSIRAVGGSGGAIALNDLRFESTIAAVPLPPAAFMGLGLLAGIAVLRRRRRRTA